MTLPRLEGWGEELARILPQLGENVAKVINPNMEQEKMLKAAIAQNPQLLQELANQESLNPGVLNKMGFGNTGKTIQGMQPSPDFALKSNISQQQSEMIRNDPTLAKDVAMRGLTGKDETERKQGKVQLKRDELAAKKEENEIEQLPTFNRLLTAQLTQAENTIKQQDLTNTRRGLAKDWLVKNPKEDTRSIAKKIIEGGMPSELAAGLMEDNSAIKEAIEKIKEENRARVEKDLVSLRNSANKEDVIERYRAQSAKDIYDELDSSEFTYDDIYSFINKEGNVTPEVGAKIKTAFATMKGQKRDKIINAVRNSMTAAQAEARRAYNDAERRGDKPAAVAGQLQASAVAIKTALEQMSSVSGEEYTVEFVEEIPKTKNWMGFGGTYGIVIRNKEGTPVNPMEIGQSSKVSQILGGINDKKTTLEEVQKHPIWETLTKEEQDKIVKETGGSVRKDSSTITLQAKEAPIPKDVTRTPRPNSNTEADSSEFYKGAVRGKFKSSEVPPKENRPVGKLDPVVVNQIDTLSAGLSKADSIKALAAQDSIEAVDEVWELAKAYVEGGSKGKDFPQGKLGTGLKRRAFTDAVAHYRKQAKK